jgi:diguanylate cyclase (GGDEF)-like protein/PAS domain S-box-containing protein
MQQDMAAHRLYFVMRNSQVFLNIGGEALDQLQAVIQAHPQLQWEIDRHFCFTDLSPGLLKLIGCEHDVVISRSIYDFMTSDEAARISRFFRTRQGVAFSRAISRHLRPDGSTVTVESSAIPLQDDQGALRGYRGISRDIIGIDLSRDKSVYRMMAIYNSAPIALCLIGRDGRYLAANNAYADIFGLISEGLVGRKAGDLLPGGDERVRRSFRLLDIGAAVPAYEFDYQGKFYQVLANPIHDAMGQVSGLTMALMEITDRKYAENKLEELNQRLVHYARSDHLTGLPNRRHVDEVLVDEAQRAIRAGYPLSVLMIDVDFFKKYNDHYGHLSGDKCLQRIASELRKSMHRHRDLIGRYGGEEFIAIMPGTDLIGALKIANTMVRAMRSLNLPHAHSHYGNVTLSVGAATLEAQSPIQAPSELYSLLLRAADRALYAAKLSGRNTAYGLATKDMPDTPHDRSA